MILDSKVTKAPLINPCRTENRKSNLAPRKTGRERPGNEVGKKSELQNTIFLRQALRSKYKLQSGPSVGIKP